MVSLIGLVDDQIRLLTFLKISDERRNAWAALFGRTDHRRVPSATRCASDVVGSLCFLCVQPPPKRKDEAEEEIEEMATRLLTETMGPQKRLPRRPRRWSINGNKHKQRAVIVQHFSLSFLTKNVTSISLNRMWKRSKWMVIVFKLSAVGAGVLCKS